MVSAFDDAAVIAGQGTVGLEILDDVPDLGDHLARIVEALEAVAMHVR